MCGFWGCEGVEKAGSGRRRRAVAQAPVGRPEQRARGAAGEAKGFSPNQEQERFEGYWFAGAVQAVDEVVKIREGSSLLSGAINSVTKFGVEAADSIGSEDDAKTLAKDRKGAAVVDAGRFDASPVTARLLEVVLGTVVASAVVDVGDHKRNRKVGLEVEALKAFDRVRR